MILDSLENWPYYAKGNTEVWNKVVDFLKSVSGETEPGKYEIQGDQVFAFVQEFDTIPIENGKIEIHCDFIDVHYVIKGPEVLFYSPVQTLDLIEDFRPASDDLLYTFQPDIAVRISLAPGQFVMFLPKEGHMTRISYCSNPSHVKKVVVKIFKELIY